MRPSASPTVLYAAAGGTAPGAAAHSGHDPSSKHPREASPPLGAAPLTPMEWQGLRPAWYGCGYRRPAAASLFSVLADGQQERLPAGFYKREFFHRYPDFSLTWKLTFFVRTCGRFP